MFVVTKLNVALGNDEVRPHPFSVEAEGFVASLKSYVVSQKKELRLKKSPTNPGHNCKTDSKCQPFQPKGYSDTLMQTPPPASELGWLKSDAEMVKFNMYLHMI